MKGMTGMMEVGEFEVLRFNVEPFYSNVEPLKLKLSVLTLSLISQYGSVNLFVSRRSPQPPNKLGGFFQLIFTPNLSGVAAGEGIKTCTVLPYLPHLSHPTPKMLIHGQIYIINGNEPILLNDPSQLLHLFCAIAKYQSSKAHKVTPTTPDKQTTAQIKLNQIIADQAQAVAPELLITV